MEFSSAKRVSPTSGAGERPVAVPSLPNPATPPRLRRRGRTVVLLLAAVVPLMATGILWSVCAGRKSAWLDVETYPVRYGQLDQPIVVRGEIEPASCSDIVCRVKTLLRNSMYSTTIKWIVGDGSQVKRGQLLVELDDSALEEELETRKLFLGQARAAWIEAEESYKIVASQSESDIKAAEVTVQLAKLDLAKYLQGDYEQTRKGIEGRLLLAESDLEAWQDRAAYCDRMVRKGFLQANQARAEKLRWDGAQIARDKIREELRVLQGFTRTRTVTELESKLTEAHRSLDRNWKQARARQVQAESNRLSKRRIYQRRRTRCAEIEEQIRLCLITAPQDGIVVYNSPDPNRGSQQPIIAQGEPVREGQVLMRLPDLTRMQLQVGIHEALVARVHGDVWQSTGLCDGLQAALLLVPDVLSRLVNQGALSALRVNFRDQDRRLAAEGQPARIRIEALPERVVRGHVQQVAGLATQQDWWSDIKVYATVIALDEPVEHLWPGMSAEVTILPNEDRSPVLLVPVQALFGSPAQGKQRKCWVLTPGGPEERVVVVGQHSERMAEVVAGLAEGEEVVLNPRQLGVDHGSTSPLPAQNRTTESGTL